MDIDNGHLLTDEEYNLFLRLQESFNQRAMGLGGILEQTFNQKLFLMVTMQRSS
jgi:hypothetical protein